MKLLLAALMALITACQSTPPATEQWTPLYLQLRLSAGKAQVQWSEGSEWATIEDGNSITVEETGRIIADAAEGTSFSLGDGSTLEMYPGAIIEVQNPRTFPRLQVILRDGSILFTAQKPSYEFLLPAGSATFLSVPSQVRIEVSGETAHLAVKEGAVTLTLEEEETITLPACRGISLAPGRDPEVTEFCAASTASPPPTPIPSPSPTPWWIESAATPSPSPTPMLTPTPTTGAPPPPPTDTPVPPTNTAPPPPPPPPRPTKTPPPPPTDTPPPPPPPTDTPPPPPPTDTPPPPPPTDTPQRPTPTSLRPTSTPAS